jgi:hypothetical protein
VEQDGYGGTIQIIRTPPLGSKANLLTSDFAGAMLFGTIGTTTLDLRIDSPPGSLTYTSDFITSFNDSAGRSFDVTFNLLVPLTSPNDLEHFVATGFDGIFSVQPGPVVFVPEPSALVLAGIGLFCLLAVCYGRKLHAVG